MNQRPSFIFILADDLGYADLGCTGLRSAFPVSPNLDRMAAEGLLMTQAYANSPVCSPTRFALMTGRWQYRLRAGAEEPLTGLAHGNPLLGLPAEHPTLPSLLREAGYRTALVGKWHLGYPPHFGPLKSGYEEFFGTHSGGVDYFSHLDRNGKRDLWRNGEPSDEHGYLTDLISRQAVDFIGRQTPEQPFLLSVHYTAPHWPWETRDDEAESRRIGHRIQHLDGGSLTTYHRMIHHMDEGIGQILTALRQKGWDDNTLVVFTSDNGGERFSDNWPFVGKKMDLLEGGIRVPLIARWPSRIAAGMVSSVPNLTMDWTATLLDAAGQPPHPDYPLDGLSLLPALTDRTWCPQRPMFWRMAFRSQKAMRDGRWKFLSIAGNEFLFDIEHDARERANLAHREPERLARMRAQWADWAATMPDIPADAYVASLYSPAEMATGSG